MWLISWIEIACALINIITFTAYRPWWDFKFMAWSSKKAVLKNNATVKREE